jgi:hypothetical protein
MAQIYVDLEYAKQFGLTEKDFAGKSEDEQLKLVDDGHKKLLKSWKNKSNSDNFANVIKELPKIKEALKTARMIYSRPIPPGKSVAELQVVGYLVDKGKVLTINPNAKSDMIKIVQVEEANILKNEEEYKKYL